MEWTVAKFRYVYCIYWDEVHKLIEREWQSAGLEVFIELPHICISGTRYSRQMTKPGSVFRRQFVTSSGGYEFMTKKGWDFQGVL